VGKAVGQHATVWFLTDIASGWTEAAAMVVREADADHHKVEGGPWKSLLFPMLGLDVDNDSAFINENRRGLLQRPRK